MLAQLKTVFVLFIISALACGLRLYRIDQSPTGALIDEAHFGYLAHSLLATGKDEHGVPFPLIFRGFGDNKLPAGAYLMVPVVKLFGLSNTTIRIPSIIAGTLLVICMYWLVRELGFAKKYGYLASLIVALSPWPFYLSRFGFESNLALLFFTLGLALLLKAYNQLTNHGWQSSLVWLVFSSASLAATWYSYISYRPVTLAILVFFWIGIWWQAKNKNGQLRSIIVAAGVSIISLLIIVAPLLLGPAAAANSTRFNQVGILNDPSTVLLVNENRTFCTMQLPKMWCYGIWNKVSILIPVLVGRYLHSFAPQFLATIGEGENIFLTIQGYGQFYSVWYPFIVLGLVWLVVCQLPLFATLQKKMFSLSYPAWLLIIAGCLFAPLPTILVGIPQQVRISPLLPFLIIGCITGVALVYSMLKNRWLVILSSVAIAGIFAYQAASFLTNYYFVHTIKNEYFYQSYLPDLYTFLSTVDPETKVYIKPFYSDPLMFYAYYTQMDPVAYQQQAVLGELEASGFQHTVGLGNIATTNDSAEYIGCQARAAGEKAFFVTNDNQPFPLVYKGSSASGVHSFVYVYDTTDPKTQLRCN